jgi:ubiquinone/menaquinone biosynthesis C-methylase UbiE
VARDRIRVAGFDHLVTFAVCDATAAPFPDASFDIVTCSLAFHHLGVCQAQAALREMARLARVGFVINDIYRAQGAWLMAWVLTRLSTGNRLTRHDGPASVYRAFTPAEMRRLGARVGLTAEVLRHPFWRMAMVWRADKG